MQDIKSAVQETVSAYSIKGELAIHDDLGWFGLGGRVARQSEIYHISVGTTHYAWKRWAPNISENNIRLQLEAIDWLSHKGIPVPPSAPQSRDNLLFLANGSRCSLFKYRRGNYYTGTLEEQFSALTVQSHLIEALRYIPFQHEDGAQPMVTAAAVLDELKYLQGAEYNPDTGTHPDELSRIKEEEIPRLITITNTVSAHIQEGEVSWVHGDFHQRNLSFNEDGTVCAVYDFDFLYKDYVVADIAHTLEMFTVHSAEPGYHSFAPPNYYRTMPFILDTERLGILVRKLRDAETFTPADLASFRSHIVMIGIWKLAFLYRQGIEGPLGRKLLAREFMFQRKLDWALTENPLLEKIFSE